MHIVGPEFNRDELASFSIRSSVDAIPCPEGAAVVDKDGNQLATYADKCYVVVDGDSRFIVSAYVFDGLYSETSEPKSTVTTSEDIAAQHAQAAPAVIPSTGVVTPAQGNALRAGLDELTDEQRAELRRALDDADSDRANSSPTPASSKPADSTTSTPDSSSTGSTTSTTGAPTSSSTPDGGASTTGADPTAAAGNATPAETASTATPSVAGLSSTGSSSSGQ